MCLQHPSFKENFRNWWRGFQGNGWEGHKFMRRLQSVKAKLKEWNKFSFGELNEKKKSIPNNLANFDAIEQVLENEMGLVLNNAESITEEILLYFEKHYASPTGESWNVEGLDWSPISEKSVLRLDSPFTEEETSKAIFQLDRDKASGPDGFTIAVFQDSLEKKGFSPRWRKWMSGCLSSVSYAVLVNGSAKGFIFQLAEMLDYKASGWPILYLGLPLGENPKACGFWDLVIERISRRLDGWQKAYLFFWGRITLIQFCLTHMPYYFLFLFKLPALMAAKIERWSHCYPWKAIAQVFQEFSLFTWFVVGNGERIQFWEDLWWGDQPLGTQYPRLFRVVLDKNILISLVLGSTRPFSWNLNFRRNLSNSEIEDLEGLMRSLDGLHLSPSVFPSKFVWNSQVPFKVRSFVWLVAHKKHGESVDHLFLHCSLTIGMWYRLFQLAKMDWIPPRSIFDMMSIKFNGFDSSKRG
ncbi:hypothetical protein CK203_050945 [Vitis vinifera]|uniref:Reverse transcriptase zinc-binding domain-containing protein n=1 Tax=Vitis vinifera TaxID=29760 RepID=A0A438H2D4_VITVI|nr:hypothetical protein CK203_050945 [Vitis vinifera]